MRVPSISRIQKNKNITVEEIIKNKTALKDAENHFESCEKIGKDMLKDTKGKAKLTLVPRKIITAISRVREYGNIKYKTSDSWKLNTTTDYQDAAFRHFIEYLDDPESLDKESGLPHLWHLAANIAFLIEGGLSDEKHSV